MNEELFIHCHQLVESFTTHQPREGSKSFLVDFVTESLATNIEGDGWYKTVRLILDMSVYCRNIHEKKHHSKNKMIETHPTTTGLDKIQCQQCAEEFESQSALLLHSVSHIQISNAGFVTMTFYVFKMQTLL